MPRRQTPNSPTPGWVASVPPTDGDLTYFDDDQHFEIVPYTMSLLRPTLRLCAVAPRAFSTTSIVQNERVLDPTLNLNPTKKFVPPARWSTQHVPPGAVVAGTAPGPATVYEDRTEITCDVVSDAPKELRHRQVRIFKPTKNTMQSAKGKTKVWRIDWDVLQGSGRWTNPLMGWQSSADYMQGTTLAFRTREEAVRFVSRLLT